MMSRKGFFQRRSISHMQDELHLSRAYSQRNLVKRILDLNPTNEGIEIRTQILPARFIRGTDSGLEASRKAYKHGELMALSQPTTVSEALRSTEIPLQIREKTFAQLNELREEEINYIGFSWIPIQGNDKRKRVVLFPSITDGVGIFAYAENFAGGIEVRGYEDAKRVRKEGASIMCSVPSRTQKKQRYTEKLVHVPVLGTDERRSIVWSLRSDREVSPEQVTYQDIRYNWETDSEGSDRFNFSPQDIAAYIGIAGHALKTDKNWTPLEMNPFALPSRKGYTFSKLLDNNVMIYDPTLQSERKLRHLHLPEKAILQARLIKVLGHDNAVYWDWERDGILKSYDTGQFRR